MRSGSIGRYLTTAVFVGIFTLMVGTAPAHADIVFTMDQVFSGDVPSSTSPFATATFHSVNSTTVTLTLQASLESATEFITEWGFNSSNLNITLVMNSCTGGCQLANNGIGLPGGTGDQYQADGDGKYDFQVVFASSNANGGVARFNGTDIAVFTITGTGISEATFSGLSAPGGNAGGPFNSALHIQGIDESCSGWVGNSAAGGASNDVGGPCTPSVPEPSSLLLLGSGLATLGSLSLLRRKRG